MSARLPALLATTALVMAASAMDAEAAAPAAAGSGMFGQLWDFIRDGQREMSDAMASAVRRLKAEGGFGAAIGLATVSFIYGVLHAVGPGHGKFVISSYALASERTVRRAMLLSFMAALIQALSAIAIVGVLALAFKATRLQIRSLESQIEMLSWGLIALFGAWLLYRQWRPAHGHAHDHADGHAHHHHDHGHGHAHHDHAHPHGAGESCDHPGHAHMPLPSELDGAWSWRKAWALAFSIGIRPCTGAIAVLILAGSIGLFWAGILSAFTMAIGTALTVSLLATLAVGSREVAVRMAGGSGVWAGRIQRIAAIGGSALVFAMGALFFIASLQGTAPF